MNLISGQILAYRNAEHQKLERNISFQDYIGSTTKQSKPLFLYLWKCGWYAQIKWT